VGRPHSYQTRIAIPPSGVDAFLPGLTRSDFGCHGTGDLGSEAVGYEQGVIISAALLHHTEVP
jgi:hypothetical protein